VSNPINHTNLHAISPFPQFPGGVSPPPLQGSPEHYFQNHLQDQYGLQAHNYDQHQLAHQASHFAAHHCGGQHDAMAALLQLVHDLKQEVALLKHGAPPSAPPCGPGHETMLQAQARLTQEEIDTKAHIRANEERLAVAELESKMAKKRRDSILQSI
jgi:hypothetical protein